MLSEEDQEFYEQYVAIRNIKKPTAKGYHLAFSKYIKSTGKHLQELLD